jgi:hypothetical protein
MLTIISLFISIGRGYFVSGNLVYLLETLKCYTV